MYRKTVIICFHGLKTNYQPLGQSSVKTNDPFILTGQYDLHAEQLNQLILRKRHCKVDKIVYGVVTAKPIPPFANRCFALVDFLHRQTWKEPCSTWVAGYRIFR